MGQNSYLVELLLKSPLFGGTTILRQVYDQLTVVRWRYYLQNWSNSTPDQQRKIIDALFRNLYDQESIATTPVQTVRDHVAQQHSLIEVLCTLAVQYGHQVNELLLQEANLVHDIGELIHHPNNGGIGADGISFDRSSEDEQAELSAFMKRVHKPLLDRGLITLAERKLFAYQLQSAALEVKTRSVANLFPTEETAYHKLYKQHRFEVVIWPWIERLGYLMDAWCNFVKRPNETSEKQLVQTFSNQYSGLVDGVLFEDSDRRFVMQILGDSLKLIEQICSELIEQRGREFFRDSKLFQGGRLGD